MNIEEELEKLYNEASIENLTEDQQTQIMTRLRILQFYDAHVRQGRLEDMQRASMDLISGSPSQTDYN